jgi:predicted MPP superfamily phosphohydrolase
VLFLLTFFSLYSLLHVYVFLKIRSAFALGTVPIIVLICFMAVMVSAPVLVRMAENRGLEVLARVLSFVGFTWLGLIFPFFLTALGVDLYRLVVSGLGLVLRMDLSHLSPSPLLAFFIPLIVTAGIAVYGSFEAWAIRSEEVVIKSPKVPEGVGNFTIVQIADVHVGLIVREGRLKRILEAVKRAKPDLLVSTGDLVDGQIDNLKGLAELLRTVKPKYGKFGVTGNHEFYAGIDQAMRFSEKAGFRMLRGETQVVAGFLTIGGVDDRTGKRFNLFCGPEEGALLKGVARGRFTILLKHEPIIAKDAGGFFDLQLSGHTHKGQIFPFNYIVKIFYPHDAGLVHLPHNAFLYVSRGSGTWGPPFRFLAPPEVTIIRLVHGENA